MNELEERQFIGQMAATLLAKEFRGLNSANAFGAIAWAVEVAGMIGQQVGMQIEVKHE
jgi:hypothetical protein